MLPASTNCLYLFPFDHELPSALAYHNRALDAWNDADYVSALRDFVQALELTRDDNTSLLLQQQYMITAADLQGGWSYEPLPYRPVTVPAEYDFAHPFFGCGDIFLNGIVASAVDLRGSFGEDINLTLQSSLSLHRSPEEALEAYNTLVNAIGRCSNAVDGFSTRAVTSNEIVGTSSTIYRVQIPVSNFFSDMLGLELTVSGHMVIWTQENFVGLTLYAESGTFDTLENELNTTIDFARGGYGKLVGTLSTVLEN